MDRVNKIFQKMDLSKVMESESVKSVALRFKDFG